MGPAAELRLTLLQELWVARKRIEREDTGGRNSRSFRTEQGALRSFKQCLTNHGNIMNSLTTFTHDGNFIIISPLADLDLRKFFCGKYSDFGVRQQRFTPLELLREAACLAGALDFLHYQLRLRDKKIACAHLDFKPDNILVQWSEGPKHFPVGKWLVHDFGTARIKEPSEEANALAPGDFLAHFSLTKAQRNPGPFQAPEVQQSKDRKVGRESDMWSFGCLLVEVLSFAIGGPDQVASLANSIYQRDPDQPNQTLTDYFYTFAANGKPILKPSLTTWLKNLRTEELEDAWIGKTLDLVSSILVDPPTSRLKALKAQVELDAICGSEEVFLERKCRFIKSEAPIPVDNSSVVGTRNREQGLHPVDRRPLSQTLNVAAPIIHTASYNNSPNPYSIDQGLHPLPPAQQYTPNHRQPGQSRNPSIVRTDTTSFQVISSPATTYPNSPDPSNQSNESSSQGHGTSLTADVTFVHLTAPDRAFKSVVCASSTRVGSMSKSSVLVHNFSIQSQWVPKRPPKSPDRVTNGFFGPQNIKCPDGFDWDLMSLCGSYVALRAHNRVEFKVRITIIPQKSAPSGGFQQHHYRVLYFLVGNRWISIQVNKVNHIFTVIPLCVPCGLLGWQECRGLERGSLFHC
jgi:serine/threonine protein kinase